MSDKKTSPQTIALLGVGSAAAVGVAVWSISGALAPRPTVRTTPTPAAPPSDGTRSTAGGPATAAIVPAPLSGSALDVTSRARASDASVPAGRETSLRTTPSGEAVLAPEADPFLPLPTRPGALVTGQAVAGQPISGQPFSAGNSAMRPSPPARSGGINGPGLQGMNPALNPAGPGARPPVTPFAAPAPPPPELVGTLLGDKPTAVFRGASELVAVPVGGTFDGWKVAYIGHGQAVVKGMGRVLRLAVGSFAPSRPADRTAPPRRSSDYAAPIRGFAASAPAQVNPFTAVSVRPAASVSTSPGAPVSVRPAPSVAVKPVSPSSLASGGAVTASSSAAEEASSDAPSGDVVPQDEALPALPDTHLAPDGRLALPAVDPLLRRDPAPAPETAPVASLRPAMANDVKPFRTLVAWNGEQGEAQSLPSRSEVAPAAAALHAAKAHTGIGRRHHRIHRHGHHHRRYSHRRPMHQQRQIA